MISVRAARGQVEDRHFVRDLHASMMVIKATNQEPVMEYPSPILNDIVQSFDDNSREPIPGMGL